MTNSTQYEWDQYQKLQAQLVLLSQMQVAIREVAGNKIFQSIQHRDETEKAIIEALEKLENDIEELAEKLEKEEE